MHQAQIDFCLSVKARFPQFFRPGNRVLDIGSMDINGTNRYLFVDPACYIGVDLIPGPGVDVVAEGHLYSPVAGSPESEHGFDVTISTECFEHNPFWPATFLKMIRLTRPGGLVLMTCAGIGRQEHGTTRTTPQDSPGSIKLFGDYYENLSCAALNRSASMEKEFAQWQISYVPCDLQFWGIKR